MIPRIKSLVGFGLVCLACGVALALVETEDREGAVGSVWSASPRGERLGPSRAYHASRFALRLPPRFEEFEIDPSLSLHEMAWASPSVLVAGVSTGAVLNP